MRALTLSAEALERGWAVAFAGDFDDEAQRILSERIDRDRVFAIERDDQREALPRLTESLAPRVVHIDSYLPEADVLLGGPYLLSSVQDGAFGARTADLTIDPTLDAESDAEASRRGATHLSGIGFAMIRPQVRAERGRWSPSSARSRVLVVLGGTDPHHYTPRVLESLSASRRRLDITVVAPASVNDEVQEIAARSSSQATVTGFLHDLPAAAVAHDLVISAAGTSVWDLACMGVPTAMVCVTENQERGYDAAAARGLAVGVQRDPSGSWAGVEDEIVSLLDDESRLRELSSIGMATVDGLGAWRVAAAWESLLEIPMRGAVMAGEDLEVRRATMADATLLFEWRNDPDTRRMSRSTGIVAWEDHLVWFSSVLSDPTRELFVVESEGQPVGTVRWDRRSGIDWEASISLAPSSRGKGMSHRVLAAGERGIRSAEARRLIAGINQENLPSRRLFARAGYLPHAPADAQGFAEYAKLLPPVGGE
ncbi:GNAT family N-acetyltransferase [Microbacterium sp. NPDC057741]